jgi:Glycosyl hydrolase family 12
MSITLNGGYNIAPLPGGYTLQANEFNSTATCVITSDGLTPNFQVHNSGINIALGGSPGAYPGMYFGNHWGVHSATTELPVSVASITGGGVAMSSCTIDWSAAPAGSVYDCSWDIFFTPVATQAQNQGTDLEMMVWMYNVGVPQPAGTKTATVTIGGNNFNVYWSKGTTHSILSYQFAKATNTATIDIGLLAADALVRGYLPSGYFLIDVEYGCELWTNGTGLAVEQYSVSIGQAPPPTTSYTFTATAEDTVSGLTGQGSATFTVS